MKYRFEILERTPCHRGFFRVDRCRIRHERFDGGWLGPLDRELLERGHAVGAVLHDPDRDELVMVEQFRIGAIDAPGGAWMLEFVAGIVEPGESPEDVVARETQEEAGLDALDLLFASEFVLSPGGCSERLALYCARVDSSVAGGVYGLAHEGEDIRVHVMSSDDALALLDDGATLSATTVVGLQWFALNRARLAARWSGAG